MENLFRLASGRARHLSNEKSSSVPKKPSESSFNYKLFGDSPPIWLFMQIQSLSDASPLHSLPVPFILMTFLIHLSPVIAFYTDTSHKCFEMSLNFCAKFNKFTFGGEKVGPCRRLRIRTLHVHTLGSFESLAVVLKIFFVLLNFVTNFTQLIGTFPKRAEHKSR